MSESIAARQIINTFWQALPGVSLFRFLGNILEMQYELLNIFGF
jgi:hypothetical protein